MAVTEIMSSDFIVKYKSTFTIFDSTNVITDRTISHYPLFKVYIYIDPCTYSTGDYCPHQKRNENNILDLGTGRQRYFVRNIS